jgi:tagatose-6-phosphate ketose/aldose isomerase
LFSSLYRLIALEESTKKERGVAHTPEEIARQPQVWLETRDMMKDLVGAIRELIDDEETIILTGAGSSYFTGQCVEAALASRHKGIARSISSTEIVMNPEGTLPRTPFTLVSFARSGNSPEGNAAFKLAEDLRPGLVKQVVFTCNDEGELARLARQSSAPSVLCVLPSSTNDAGLAMTSSFTSMVVAGFVLAYRSDFPRYEAIVSTLAKVAENLGETHGEILKHIAETSFNRVFFVGASPFYGAAQESHLKVQEMTDGQVIGKPEDTLGLRHGPMAAIDKNTLVVLFASIDAYRRRYETDLLKELSTKELGCKRLVVCPHPESGWENLCHHVLDFGGDFEDLTDDVLSPVLVLPAQIIGLFKSLELGLLPDTPSRKRVISRVVEGVTIYPYAK